MESLARAIVGLVLATPVPATHLAQDSWQAALDEAAVLLRDGEVEAGLDLLQDTVEAMPFGSAQWQQKLYTWLWQFALQLTADGELELSVDVLLVAADRWQLEPDQEAFLRILAADRQKEIGAPDEALEELAEAEALLEDRPADASMRATLYGIRGQILLNRGLLDRASIWLDRERSELADMQARGVDVSHELLSAHFHAVNQALAFEDYRWLDELVETALQHPVYRVRNDERARLQIRLGFGLNERERIDPEREPRARLVLEQALEEPTLGTLDRVHAVLVLAELAIREGDHLRATELLEAARSDMESSTGLDAAPRRRLWAALSARQSLDRGAADSELRSWRSELEALFIELLEQWRHTPPRPGGYGILQYSETQALLSELFRLILHLDGDGGPRTAFERLLEIQELGSLARRDPVRTDVAGLQAGLLAEGHLVLVYFPAPERTHLFLMDVTRVDHVELQPEDSIEQVRSRLVSTLVQPSPDPARRAEQDELRAALAALLLPAEVAARVTAAQRLSVVGLDLLGETPFESLPVGEAALLGTFRPIDHLPSLPFALQQARRIRGTAPVSGGTRLFLAARVDAAARGLQPSLVDIPLDPLAAAALLDGCGAGPHEVVERFGEILGPVGEGPGSALRVLQFFTHGVLDPIRERPAGLMTGDAPLFAEGVEDREWPLLVVLAACRTGRAPIRRGDAGSTDLGGAFLARGAQAVVLSAFDLELEAAKRMTRTLHAVLGRGESPAEAMRVARAELSADPRFADPFYHSLLRVMGLGHEPVFPAVAPAAHRSGRGVAVLAAVGLALAGVGLLAVLLLRD